jgi:hypothetical protein
VLLPLLGLDVKKAAAPYKVLVSELTRVLGPRVVPAADVVKAQVTAGVLTSDFATAPSIEKVAAIVEAERAITATVEPTMTTVRVYASLQGAPPLVIELPRKKNAALDAKWATATAEAIATRAEDALAPRIEAPVVDLSEPEPEPLVEAAPPPSPSAAVARLPWLMGAVGGGVALRSLGVSGPLASKVSPMNAGFAPSVSAFVALRPLVLVDNAAWWNDLLVEGWGRRGLVDARVGETTCSVDDDDVSGALSWRARVSDNPIVPRLGAGASVGYERVIIGACGVPALSTSSTELAGFARLGWALLPGVLEIDALGGARVPLVGDGSGFERPGILAQVAVLATPVPGIPNIFVRGVGRAFESRLTHGTGPDLVVGDLRSSFELQIGGAL